MGVTLFGLLLTPVFYVLIRKRFRRTAAISGRKAERILIPETD
jgi:hypothetical protein